MSSADSPADHGVGHSVLQVPVPALDPWVRRRTAFYDTDYLSDDPAFTHAHITALGPFLPRHDARTAARVGEVVARFEPFDFTLRRLATFPNGIVHLVPEPAEPFSRLTSALFEEFDQCPPYGGAFGIPQPHLTLDALSADVTENSTRKSLGAALPARCRAERLDLAWYQAGDCRLLDSWTLGSALGRTLSQTLGRDPDASAPAAQNS
ncbi:2'-5' RNA ligase family protein [Nocardioides sp. 616]|uniref:2'-5' RNA ligase family protein n=1 Tax=Nocardioides sp. 616 TaxID=2268090 RepID=UPI000CE47359|nr:2'-5' RNA ligase family protein [Nocardioides sp. 616]